MRDPYSVRGTPYRWGKPSPAILQVKIFQPRCFFRIESCLFGEGAGVAQKREYFPSSESSRFCGHADGVNSLRGVCYGYNLSVVAVSLHVLIAGGTPQTMTDRRSLFPR
jgi:hypothetical protein